MLEEARAARAPHVQCTLAKISVSHRAVWEPESSAPAVSPKQGSPLAFEEYAVA